MSIQKCFPNIHILIVKKRLLENFPIFYLRLIKNIFQFVSGFHLLTFFFTFIIWIFKPLRIDLNLLLMDPTISYLDISIYLPSFFRIPPSFQRVDHLLPISNCSEDYMLLIKPWAKNTGNIELASIVAFFAVIGHANSITSIMTMDVVFIFECLSVNTLTSSTISMSNIPSLYHESGNNPVKSTALVV